MAKYRVAGSRRVFGVEPGDTFVRDLDPVTEERLLQGGAITRVSTRSYRRSEPEETTPASQAEQTEAAASEEVTNDG